MASLRHGLTGSAPGYEKGAEVDELVIVCACDTVQTVVAAAYDRRSRVLATTSCKACGTLGKMRMWSAA